MDRAGAASIPVNVKVPDEVLDQQGYETYMDGKDQVMLRKRQPRPLPHPHPHQPAGAGLPHQQPLPLFRPSNTPADPANQASGIPSASAANANAKAAFESHSPKPLEELVQQVMRDLPQTTKRTRIEAEEALRKLDRRFDRGGLGEGERK